MKKSLAVLIAAAVLLACSLGAAVYAANAGSAEDPVVTKAYVDQITAELKAELSKSTGSAGSQFTVLEALPKGTKITGGASSEMILRSGAAKTYIPSEAGGGLSDLTAGKDVGDPKTAGVQVVLNHLLLFPRDDGRALVVTSDKAYIMVKGSYTITEP